MRRKAKLSKAEARKARQAAKGKGPSTGAVPSGKKRPAPGSEIPRDPEAKMVFRLSMMDSGGRWGFSNLSVEHVKLISDKCKGFEGMTVGQLMALPSSKQIEWNKMCRDAQKRAETIQLDHFDGLVELRLGGRERLWGILEGHCFYIVWWDPDHEVCPSTKKNT